MRVAEKPQESFDAFEPEIDAAAEIQLTADGFVGGDKRGSAHAETRLQVLVEACLQRLEQTDVPTQLLPLGRDDVGRRTFDELLVR
jgi:hypothetical protein